MEAKGNKRCVSGQGSHMLRRIRYGVQMNTAPAAL